MNTGTHLLRNITSVTTEVGVIMVSGEFIDTELPPNETARGFIAIAYNTESNTTDDMEHLYGKASRAGREQHAEAMISGLSRNNYRVSVFILERNGLPLNKSAATAREVSNIMPLTGKINVGLILTTCLILC